MLHYKRDPYQTLNSLYNFRFNVEVDYVHFLTTIYRRKSSHVISLEIGHYRATVNFIRYHAVKKLKLSYGAIISVPLIIQ